VLSARRLVPALQASSGRFTELNLSANTLGAAAGPLAIAALGDPSSCGGGGGALRLILADVGLDDSGAVLLAEALRRRRRRQLLLLDLFSNPIGDVGAAALLAAISSVAAEAAQQQQQQQQQWPVERLDLGCTDVSDASADALRLLLTSGVPPALRALGLALTGLSAALLAELQPQQHPDTKMFVDVRGTAATRHHTRNDSAEDNTLAQVAAGAGLLALHPLCDYRAGVFRLWLLDTFGAPFLKERGEERTQLGSSSGFLTDRFCLERARQNGVGLVYCDLHND
jgi:hypothetical protein